MKPKISVIVPSYNEGPYLKACFDSLRDQTATEDQFEVIMIDNNSEDNSFEIMQKYAEKYQNFRAFSETKQGLSNSRNRGVEESSGEYLAFMDGDAKAHSNWIQLAIEIAEQEQPDIFGGPIHPYYVTEKPSWFKDDYELRMHHDTTGPLPAGKYISGSNIIFKRSTLAEFGGFNPDMGMKGKQLAYGEESVLIKRAHDEGKKLYYHLDLIVDHLVPEYKMNLLFFLSTRFERGISGFQMKLERGKALNIESSEVERQRLINAVETTIGKFPDEFKRIRYKEYEGTAEQLVVEELAPKLYKLGMELSRQKQITGQTGGAMRKLLRKLKLVK